MLFVYLITGILAAVAVLSLRNNFGDSRLFIGFILLGLAVSWWQQKRNKPIPLLKVMLNIALVGLTLKALSPLIIRGELNILNGLIKTCVYFLAISAFIIYSKRDYYFIQALSLCLIIFSCFDKTAPKSMQLNYIFTFFIFWIIGLRGISLLKYIKEIRQILPLTRRIYQEFKMIILFILMVIILSIPLYSFIPRLNIPLPYIPYLAEQRDTLTYADFPGKNVISFLSRSLEKLTQAEKTGKADKTGKQAKQGLTDLEKTKSKPVFWHSAKEDKGAGQKIKEQESKFQSQTGKTDKGAEKTRLLDLLSRILSLAILLLLLFLFYRIISFFFPYLRERKKFKRAALENKYNLGITLLYNFLCRILNIFGYRYPVIIDPEEYSAELSRRFKKLEPEHNQMTVLFLEARYSTHQLAKAQIEKALSSYRNILKELKDRGSFWQKIILKLNFLFNL